MRQANQEIFAFQRDAIIEHERLISVQDLNMDIFECFTNKLLGKELLYLKNLCNINLTSVSNVDLYKGDIYLHYVERSPREFAKV